MRMWMIDPSKLCRRHLLGEHLECHMFLGTLRRGRSVTGYLENNQFEPRSLYARHEAIAAEMIARGYGHHTPMRAATVEAAVAHVADVRIDTDSAQRTLMARCHLCRATLTTNTTGGTP